MPPARLRDPLQINLLSQPPIPPVLSLSSSQANGTSSQSSDLSNLKVLLANDSSAASTARSPPSQTGAGPSWLVLDLFAGMDGLGHAMDSLGMESLVGPVIIVYLFEVDPRCRAVLSEQRVS